ncbi:hypothetical protein K6119_05085 [Paracrocinitomix mangrovi]|uniref:transglutaminase domain-containing protein n=1 Tax=Paracrocinitomix mangrovi TaxID=2862509 RepID=UPI001C8D748A|nr:transglutaminase domain-containing protein [Paracrocinitomix mangrovi]UKN02887.1 hypothetical protein K6119_05085 [Paracrocinitomix mangrovi]
MRLIILTLNLLIVFYVNAGCELPSHLKAHADTLPRAIQKDHKKVSEFLVKPCKNEAEKVQIFSYWIAKNIRYDLKHMKQINRNKIAREVLYYRSAVCGGFSNLLKQFCDNENVLCYTVQGIGRGNFFQRYFTKLKCRHAWNVAYVDGEWKCLDVTWLGPELKSPEFKKDLQMKWIFEDPVEFSKSHLPYDPRWQLIKDPNTKKEFWRNKDIEERNYNWRDSIATMITSDQVEAKLITLKGAFIENNDAEAYMNGIINVGWRLVGGTYDSLETIRAIEVFQIAQNKYTELKPYKSDNKHLSQIKLGQHLCRKRLEMKE